MGAKTQLYYHVIVTTKQRKKSLLGIAQQVYSAFRQGEDHSSFEILAMGIEDGNHIHLVITSPPQYSVSGIVNRLKGWTLKHLWDDNHAHMSQFYWGKKKKLWHGGYYCDTIGKVSQKKMLDYVKNHNGEKEEIHR